MPGDAKPTLRLRTEEFDKLAAAITGARTDRELAERLGVSFNHLSQVRVGARTPGPQFIAAVRNAMPHVAFETLFDVVETSPAASTAGDLP